VRLRELDRMTSRRADPPLERHYAELNRKPAPQVRRPDSGGAERMALQTAFGQKVSRTAFWRRFERVPKSLALIASNRLTGYASRRTDATSLFA